MRSTDSRNRDRSSPTRHSLRAKLRSALRRTLAWSLMGCAVLGAGACTRAKYRYKTNREAYYLIDEKVADACEQTAPYRIEVDPHSRMFDPFNPDRPPMPDDDPVANSYMRLVDRKKGYPLWEANGRTNTAENPQWWSYLPLDERGVLVLDVNDAVRQALLHSPAYQQAQETLFLSALDVSSERFCFIRSSLVVGRGSTPPTDHADQVALIVARMFRVARLVAVGVRCRCKSASQVEPMWSSVWPTHSRGNCPDLTPTLPTRCLISRFSSRCCVKVAAT